MAEEIQEMMDIRDRIRRFIVERFIYEDNGAQRLRDEMSLLDEGIMDSFGVHEMIMFVEEEYGIKIEDEEATPDHLGSVDAIVAFVSAKRAAAN
mgnify:CR=1 FL=1